MGLFRKTTVENNGQTQAPKDVTEAALNYYYGISTEPPLSMATTSTVSELPSSSPTETSQERKKAISKGTVTGIAAVAVVSALTPAFGPAQVAHASENSELPSENHRLADTKSTPSETVIAIGVPKNTPQNNLKPIAIAAPSQEKTTAAPIAVAVPQIDNKESGDLGKISVAPIASHKDVEPIAVAVPQETVENDAAIEPLIIGDEDVNQNTTVQAPPIITTPEPEKGLQDESIKKPLAVDAPQEKNDSVEEEAPAPIMPVKEPTIEEAPEDEPNLDTMTEEEVKAYTIKKDIERALFTEGDIRRGASFILENYDDKTKPVTEFDTFGNPVREATNGSLVKNVDELITVFDAASDSREDLGYINNTRAALAVLYAAGNNQDILKSPAVQDLIKEIKRPSDDYLGQLFDKYMDTSKTILTADESALLKGFDDSYKDQLITVYGYALLASITDKQQGEEIQEMKHAEAEAARKAKEEADREDRERADRERDSSNENVSNPSETLLLEAIDRAADRYNWSRNKRLVLKAGAELGVELSPLTGFGGNVAIESAGFNPIILERGFEDNPNRGLGLVQYTNYIGPNTKFDENGQAIGGRRTVYEAAARNAGFDPRSDTSYKFIKWQVKYIIDESKRREARDDTTKNEWEEFIKIKDPAKSVAFFRWNFERPGTPHAIPRERAGIKLYDQLHREVEKIKDEKARERTRQEARERQRTYEDSKEDGPTFNEAVRFAKEWFFDRDKYQTSLKASHRRVQCTALVTYFTNRYVLGSIQEGHGKDVANLFAKRSEIYRMDDNIQSEDDYVVFSMDDGKAGHTGLVMTVKEDGSIIVVESNVRNDIQNANGLIEYADFGNKKVENWRKGQVNIERWKSLDHWKSYWKSKGFYNFEYASPDDASKIAANFEKGSRF